MKYLCLCLDHMDLFCVIVISSSHSCSVLFCSLCKNVQFGSIILVMNCKFNKFIISLRCESNPLSSLLLLSSKSVKETINRTVVLNSSNKIIELLVLSLKIVPVPSQKVFFSMKLCD